MADTKIKEFSPDHEIEEELASLHALVCLGKLCPGVYRTRYHEISQRKHSSNYAKESS